MFYEKGHSFNLISHMICRNPPVAMANMEGSRTYPNIRGTVSFYEITGGVIVTAALRGLPENSDTCGGRVFGFHIHEGTQCTGTEADPFANALGHYNPLDCPHPGHAGDMPPLFGCDGTAWMAFFTNRFTISEVLGRAVILHANPDDFTTQPSGNSGEKIACGLILSTTAI